MKEKDATFEMKLDLNEAFPDSPPMMVEAWTEMENANLDAEVTKFSIMLTGSMQGNGRGLSAGDARKFAEALTMAADHVEGISRPADSKPMSYMELHDKYIRTLADLDNQRKRAKNKDRSFSTQFFGLGTDESLSIIWRTSFSIVVAEIPMV